MRPYYRFFVRAIAWMSLTAPIAFGADTFTTQRLDPANAHFRRPVAAGFVGEHLACVANSRSGSISVVDVAAAEIIGEWRVGEQLSDLAVLPGQPRVLVTDEKRHELIALELVDNDLRVLKRLPVSRFPISVRIDPDGHRATVAGLWSHRLDVVDLTNLGEDSPTLRVLKAIAVPFPPRCQLLLPEGEKLLLADAFGGRLAVVDLAAGKLVAEHAIDGHNIRGLAATGDGQSAILVYQRLSSQPITPEAIEAGSLLKSLVGLIPLAEIMRPEGGLSVNTTPVHRRLEL